MSLRPSSPSSLLPHVQSEPSVLSAAAYPLPAATLLQSVALPTGTGASNGPDCVCAKGPVPQPQSEPSSLMPSP